MTENDFHFVWAYIAAKLCKCLHCCGVWLFCKRLHFF